MPGRLPRRCFARCQARRVGQKFLIHRPGDHITGENSRQADFSSAFSSCNSWRSLGQPLDLPGREFFSPTCLKPGVVELIGDFLIAHAMASKLLDHGLGPAVVRIPSRFILPYLDTLLPGLICEIARRAKLKSLAFLGCQGCLCPGADGLALMLGDGGENADRQGIGLGDITAYEWDLGIPKLKDKCGVTREAIELGDNQGGVDLLGMLDRLCQLWPVVILARLDLDEFSDQTILRLEVLHDDLLLGLESEA